MPSTLPSTFASAAAGRDDIPTSRNPRTEGSTYGEWSRRPNGATQTFRRTSTATSITQTQPTREQNPATPTANAGSANAYVPPQVSASRNGAVFETRYSKGQLLDLYRAQKLGGDLDVGLADLFVGEPNLAMSSGAAGGRWARREEAKSDVQPGTDACWDRGGEIEPLGLEDLTDAEKELFSTSVNSTVKANPAGTREGGQRESGNNRRSSVSQGYSGNAMASPSVIRGPNRRRELSESYPFPRDMNIVTTGLNRGSRDEPATAHPALGLLRRKTELMDSEPDIAMEDTEGDSGLGGGIGTSASYGTVKRRMAGPMSAGLAGPASPWGAGPTSSGFASMGAFGNFALGATPTTATGRSESRFRGLMSKASMEGQSSSAREHSTFGPQGGFNPDELLEEDHDAADGGAGNNNRRTDDNSRYLDAQTEDTAQARNSSELLRGTFRGGEGSPTIANAYYNPAQHLSEAQGTNLDDPDHRAFHLPGLGGVDSPSEQAQHSNDLRGIDRTTSYDARYFERGHPSNIQTRGFSGFGGIGTLGSLGSPGPWSTTNATFGTPTRERNGFPEMFAHPRAETPGDVQSPSLGGTAGGNAFGAIGGAGGIVGSTARGSRIGSLFSAAAQDQGRLDQPQPSRDSGLLHSEPDAFDSNSMAVGVNAFGIAGQFRDTDSPARAGRTKFEDLFAAVEQPQSYRGTDHFGGPDQTPINTHFPQSALHGPGQFAQAANFPSQPQAGQRIPSLSSTASNQPPASQQKTMVMPDRIRWIYRDPQGKTQGPWSGLEMHDWYRAGFFSPELLVKKVEDADYEPLAQLIRRIGNSREPFLVPQIGIPGPPTSQSGSWPTQSIAALASPVTPAVQPPFAGSFPSFGTTLTAEQQNALEQRKQEEQYLMARQKEHLAQQQMLMKMQMQGGHPMRQQSLQHQQSVQSLNSQPSFGNLATPGGFQSSSLQSLSQTVQPGLTGNEHSYNSGVAGNEQEDFSRMLDHMSLGRETGSGLTVEQAQVMRQQFGADDEQIQRIGLLLDDRARIAAEQAEGDRLAGLSNEQEFMTNQRLQEFRNLRQQFESDNLTQSDIHDLDADQSDAIPIHEHRLSQQNQSHDMPQLMQVDLPGPMKSGLSLAEQVQKAASAKQSPLAVAQTRFDNDSGEATPPPQSISPLPAPAARRNRAHVADALTVESISQSHSPNLETPTTAALAPWARESAEPQKLPSLKEIQEAEARNAAKQEEIAAALRRVQLEKELAMPAPAPAPAPGLPSTSTWASTDTIASPAATVGSPWSKANAGKVAGTSSGTSTKKTMQQIVQEEEALARKKKAAAAAVAATAGLAAAAQASAMGKRYADLASKVSSTGPLTTTNSAWTTVGASGKPKVPVTASSSSATTKAVTPTATVPAQIRPKAVTTASKTSLAAAQLNAHEEFKKWAVAELRPDLHKDIQVDDFVQNLLNFPLDMDLITEAVHMSSRTVDSRHFAEEFVRRRALADKGKIAEPSANSGSAVSGGSAAGGAEKSGSGGWSEVARKGSNPAPAKAEDTGAFKIVAAKKKSSKK